MISCTDIINSREFDDLFESMGTDQMDAVESVDLTEPDAKEKLYAQACKLWAIREVRAEIERRSAEERRES
jgi:hypothetical protein